MNYLSARLRARPTSQDYLLVALRECAPPNILALADNPERAADYIRKHAMHGPCYRPDVENAWVVFLNCRRRIVGHVHLSCGTSTTLLIEPSLVFKHAIVANAAAILLAHNHPSGDPNPSEADIKVTRDLVRASQYLKIDVLDHLVMGHPAEGKGFCSLRELGYFYS